MNRWERRIERATELSRQYPVSAELLYFYRDIARFQSTVSGTGAEHLEPLLALIRRTAPDPLAQAAHLPVTWDDLLRGADPLHAFFARVLLQPVTEQRARARAVAAGVQPACPFCTEKPVAAVLRPEGDGGKRFLLCSLCFTEWEFRRVLCPSCGEEDKEKLPVFSAEEFPHVRVEACDTCRVYIKTIDLTRDGLAVPEVDEIAAIALDLWAGERGYTKLQANLFGL
jgi:FdhE protein